MNGSGKVANKNIEMLKVFFKVMSNNEDATNIIIPNSYVKDVYSIDYKGLKKKGYKYLIFDIDNTILPVNDTNVPDKLVELFNNLDKEKFKVCIVSNNHLERVLPVATSLDVLYLHEAKKPNKEAFDKALKILQAEKENTVMIGDQMLTDIKGANQEGIYSILVEPVDNKYDIKTGTSRVLQNIMVKKLERKNIFHRNNYYK